MFSCRPSVVFPSWRRQRNSMIQYFLAVAYSVQHSASRSLFVWRKHLFLEIVLVFCDRYVLKTLVLRSRSVWRHSVPIKTLRLHTFYRNLKVLRVEWQNSTPRCASLPKRGNENIKYFISSCGNRTHNLRVNTKRASVYLFICIY